MIDPKDVEHSRARDRERPQWRRLAAYCQGYLHLIVLTLALTVLVAGAEYGRAYLLKLLIDDVAIPQASLVNEAGVQDWLPDLALLDPVRTDPAEESRPAVSTLSQEDRRRISTHIENNLLAIFLLAALIAVALRGLGLIREYIAAYTLGRIRVDMSREACAKLLVLPLAYHHGKRRGAVFARVASDLSVAHGALGLIFGDILAAGIRVLVGVGFMLVLSWQLALFMAAGTPLIFGTIALFGKLIRRGARKRQIQVSEVTQRLLEILEGIKVIKVFNAEATEYAAYSRETVRLFKRSLRVTRNRVLARTSVEFMNQVMTLAGLGFGGYLLWREMWGITIGNLAAFMVMTSLVYRPLKKLAQGWVQIQDAMAGAERYFEVLDTPIDIRDAPDAVDVGPISDCIVARDLSFGYGPEPVLRNLDFHVRAGDVVAIVGRTGAGKTTLVNLLMRLYDPQQGSIEIDGNNLQKIRRASLVAQMAVVTQEPFLFDGSIRDNLLYGRPEATEDEMLMAARAAHVDQFVSELASGYDTQVGPSGGIRLSGGQRQRVTIGRAILKDPSILILDEATSSLDSKSEKFVQEAIDTLLSGNRTVFVIAHRLATVRRADQILVLENGAIAERGTHAQLMETGGLYQELVELQTGEPAAPAAP